MVGDKSRKCSGYMQNFGIKLICSNTSGKSFNPSYRLGVSELSDEKSFKNVSRIMNDDEAF